MTLVKTKVTDKGVISEEIDGFEKSTFTVEIDSIFKNPIQGSIQQTSDGSSYLVGGPEILVSSASNGQVTISYDRAKIKKAKRLFTIQLETPTPTPTIAPGVSHVYAIDLGAEYQQIGIANFEWVDQGFTSDHPGTVIANASLPTSIYGDVLFVNTTPGGWVRSFEIPVPEYQDGNVVDVNAPFSADSSDVSAPLGYGNDKYHNVLDHVNLQTTPPKKLQIEDAYLEGNYLKITIKNYDSVSINLSAYAGITALIDDGRTPNMCAVSENGAIAYLGYNQGLIRLSEDGGSTFRTLTPRASQPDNIRPSGFALTSDSISTFIGLYSYSGVRVAQSPDYVFSESYSVSSNLPAGFTPFWTGGYFSAGNPVGGKLFDWKKTSTESCALFSGFLNYYTIQVYKSIDDCQSFGNNAPLFNNNQPIFNAGDYSGLYPAQLADFRNARSETTFLSQLKAEVKVIDENTHYLSLCYWAQPETFNNGFLTDDIFIGPQYITGASSIVFELRNDELVFKRPFLFNGDTDIFQISGSTVGNNGLYNTGGTVTSGFVQVYYAGAVTVGVESVSLLSSEFAVLDADWSSTTPNGKVGDLIDTPFGSDLTIAGLRDVTIDSVNYKVINTVNRIDDGATSVTFSTRPAEDGGGSPLSSWGSGVQVKIFVSRPWPINGKSYQVWRTSGPTLAVETSPSASLSSSSPNLSLIFKTTCETQKSILLKTTDGGTTWNSVMEHPEFRYAPAHVFHASNDGQTLLVAAIKYWSNIGYEKWPYPFESSKNGGFALDYSVRGGDARFNISTDGGATWRNASGSWDAMASGLINTNQGQRTSGMVMTKISESILSVLYTENSIPVLYRSLDDGVTWSSPIKLKESDTGNVSISFNAFGNDSKDNFMGFFGTGAGYDNRYLFFGKLVDKFTSWPVFAVK